MSDPFKAAATVLKKTLGGLKQDAADKYNKAQKVTADAKKAIEKIQVDVKKANDESIEATNVFKGAQARLDAFLDGGSDASVPTSRPAPAVAKASSKFKKKTAKKKAAKKVVKKAKTKATPKKKAAKKIAAKAAPKKAAKKAKAAPKKKAKSSKKAQAAAAAGRRDVAEGKRPVLREAMAIVMGKQSMSAKEVLEGLQKRNWEPNAKKPQQYISYMLSSNKDTFQTKKRGVYTVKAGVSVDSKWTTKAAVTPPQPKAPAKSTAEVDASLSDLGITDGNVAPNPFGATATA